MNFGLTKGTHCQMLSNDLLLRRYTFAFIYIYIYIYTYVFYDCLNLIHLLRSSCYVQFYGWKKYITKILISNIYLFLALVIKFSLDPTKYNQGSFWLTETEIRVCISDNMTFIVWSSYFFMVKSVWIFCLIYLNEKAGYIAVNFCQTYL